MDETGQRLRNCAENCINAYDAWQGSRQNVAARESLQEAVHELRKVAAKLEIEVAISEREELTQRPIPIPPHRAARRRDQNGSELPDFLMDGPRSPRSQGNDFSSDDEGDMDAQSSNFVPSAEGRSGGRTGGQNRHMGQRRVGQNRRPQQSQSQTERSQNQQERQDRQNSASISDNNTAPKELTLQPPRERETRDTPPNREGTMSLGNMNTIASNNLSNNLSNNSGPTPDAAQAAEASPPPSYEGR